MTSTKVFNTKGSSFQIFSLLKKGKMQWKKTIKC